MTHQLESTGVCTTCTVAAQQGKPLFAGESNQHCSSPCSSSVELGSTNVTVLVITTVIKLTSHIVAVEQDQPFSAGESDQHCSSACRSSVEPGAADAAADAGRHDPGAV